MPLFLIVHKRRSQEAIKVLYFLPRKIQFLSLYLYYLAIRACQSQPVRFWCISQLSELRLYKFILIEAHTQYIYPVNIFCLQLHTLRMHHGSKIVLGIKSQWPNLIVEDTFGASVIIDHARRHFGYFSLLYQPKQLFYMLADQFLILVSCGEITVIEQPRQNTTQLIEPV